jgi:hypothetical protein
MNREKTYGGSLRLVMAGMEACWLYTALLLVREKTGSDALLPLLVLLFYPLSWLLHRICFAAPGLGLNGRLQAQPDG